MVVEVARDAVDAMVRAAEAAHPQEACGLLLGTGDRIESALEAKNVHAEPMTHFEIDPQALIDAHRSARKGGAQVVGYFHSHPNGPIEPSSTDRALAAGDGRIWAIVGKGTVRLWRDQRVGFAELSYDIIDA